MTAAVIRNWPVVLGAVMWLLGAPFGFIFCLVFWQPRSVAKADQAGYERGYKAHVQVTAEALEAGLRRTGRVRPDPTRRMPAINRNRPAGDATAVMPNQRSNP